MNAKICDRCGITYEKSSKHPTRGRIHGGYISGIAYYCDGFGGVDAVADLCDECLGDLLFDFMIFDETKQNHDIEED